MAKVEVKLKWNGDQNIKDMQFAMQKALIRSTNLIQSDAKLKSPVDKGNLRSSIVTMVEAFELIGVVSTNLEYAPYVEFGLKSNPNYPRQPYLRPALAENKANIRKIFIQEGSKVAV